MTMHPCACGETATVLSSSALFETKAGLARRYFWNCPKCQTPREFKFALPEWPFPATGAYGGDDPSQLLDAGDWLWVATSHAERARAQADAGPAGQAAVERWLGIAVAALDEALKFFPPAAEEPPPEAFFTERGREMRRLHPEWFGRPLLEAQRDRYRGVLDSHRRGGAKEGQPRAAKVELDRMVDSLIARMRRYAATRDDAIVLSPDALRELQALVAKINTQRLSSDDFLAAYVAAMLYWYRYEAVPEGQGNEDVAVAVRLFAAVQEAAPALITDPNERPELPEPVRLLLENRLR